MSITEARKYRLIVAIARRKTKLRRRQKANLEVPEGADKVFIGALFPDDVSQCLPLLRLPIMVCASGTSG